MIWPFHAHQLLKVERKDFFVTINFPPLILSSGFEFYVQFFGLCQSLAVFTYVRLHDLA